MDWQRQLTAPRATVEVPRVLFVCVQNAGRSQLAAMFLQQLAGRLAVVDSAGSRPAEALHENVAQVMTEHGASVAGVRPQALTEGKVRSADYVITMGCGDDCPVFDHVHYEDWPVGDPDEADWEALEQIVADIERRVADFWDRLRR
ncbi:low molecular weight phosphatase family protein [Micrococcus luteus]